TYVASRQLVTGTIIGYYGVLGAGAAGSFLLTDGLIMNPSLVPIGGAAQPGGITVTPGPFPGTGTITVLNTGNRNLAPLAPGAPLGSSASRRRPPPVRQSIPPATRDDSRTTLERIDLVTGEDTVAAVVPENPATSVFGTTRANINPRWMVADSAGTTAYAI